MRRVVSLLLLLAVLLCGCGRAPEQSVPLEELLKPDHLPEPPAPEPPAPQTADDPLPSSGVWTDESDYTPRETPKAKYSRPEGDLSRYVPGQGPLYPYYAGECQFGFCTADGALLTDPIYEQIGVRNGPDSDKPFWVVIPHPESPEDLPLCGAVSADGSVVIDCSYDSISGTGEYLKCARDEFYTDFDLYDREGRLLLKANGLDYAFSGEVPEERRGELFRIYELGPERPENYLVSPDGSRLGPFRSVSDFSEGLACATEDYEHWGYIDETGDWVITPRYNFPFGNETNFRDGRAIQNTDDGDILIDRAGNILLACHSNCMYRQGENFGVRWEEFTAIHDRDGNELYRIEGDWYFLDNDVLCDWEEGSGYTLRSLTDPERQAQFPAACESPSHGVIYAGGKLLKGFVADDSEQRIRYWVSEDLEHMGYAPQPPVNWDSDYNNRYGLFRQPSGGRDISDLWTGERYYTIYEKSVVLIFSEDGELRWTCPLNSRIAIIGGRLGVVTDRDCAYYEPDGSVSFRFPFFVEQDG